MKKLMCGILAAAALLPVAAFAQQSSGQMTRAQVRADLVQVEAAGYRPSTHDGDYPQSLMKAEAKVASLNQNNTAYGGAPGGSLESGAHPHVVGSDE
jgi:hypothetical protein